MILFIDTIHHYQNPALQTGDASCWLRIYSTDGGIVVVLSELAENPGVSVTNAAAALATEIARIYDLETVTTFWVEHYGAFSYTASGGDETFDLVTFTWRNRTASNSEWQRLNSDQLHKLLRESVKA